MDRMTPLERELLASLSALQTSHDEQMSALRAGFETQVASLMAGFESVTSTLVARLNELEKTQRACGSSLRALSERQDGTDQTLARLSIASSDRLTGLNGTLTALSERLTALSEPKPRR